MVGQLRAQLEADDFGLEPTGVAADHAAAGGIERTGPSRATRRWRAKTSGTVLVRTVEAEIIPRMFLALRRAKNQEPTAAPTDDQGIGEFAQVVLAGDTSQACAYVEALRGRGQSLEAIYLDLIEPTARHFGRLWNDDACDFVAVTVGILRLQQVLHEFGLAFRSEVEPHEHGHRALLIPAPGEKDTFGHLMFGTFELALAAEFLRRDGWDACVDSSASCSDAIRFVRSEWFDIIELSLSSENRLDDLTRGIRSIRKASRNRAIGVIVGGPVFREHPEMVTRVGADAAAADGRQAALHADNLIDLLRPR